MAAWRETAVRVRYEDRNVLEIAQKECVECKCGDINNMKDFQRHGKTTIEESEWSMI